MMNFRVDLETYRGPLDLLLYLVRGHEVDITDISVSSIATQYLEYLAATTPLDVNAVGDFLEMASILMEIKSRMVLPPVDEEEGLLEDPRDELVERLLQYKKYKDVAHILEEQSRRQQQSYPRLGNDLPQRPAEPADQPIHEVELWDLVSAMGRILRQNDVRAESTIVYDETPIHIYMQQIHRLLLDRGRIAISETFRPGMHKSALIGIFLAVLELIRHHTVEAEQEGDNGEIWITQGHGFRELPEAEDDADDEHRRSGDAIRS